MQQVTVKYVLFECLLLRVYRNSVVGSNPTTGWLPLFPLARNFNYPYCLVLFVPGMDLSVISQSNENN